ncbi:MAG: hypothetical protein GY861_18335 [bacterium]|nr:hypothetical protein [bacterium]
MADKQIKINRFLGGTMDETRDLPNGYFRYLENVDVDTDSHGAKQVANIETDTNDRNIKAISPTDGSAYGLGWENDSTVDVTIWNMLTETAVTNGTAASYNMPAHTPLFEFYNGTYYFSSTTHIGKYVTSTTTMTGDVVAVAGGSNGMKGGCVFKGDIYCWAGNQDIYVFNTTTELLTQKISTSDNQNIKELVPYGNYILIICSASVSGVKSKMYIWDGVSTTTFTDIIEIGYGNVLGADLLDGIVYALVGFKNQRGFRLKAYNGTNFQTQITYNGRTNNVSALNYAIPSSKLKMYNDYLYFLCQIARPDSTYADVKEMVLFRYGKKDATRNNALSVYKTMEIEPSGAFTSSANDFAISEDSLAATEPEQLVFAAIEEDGDVKRDVRTKTTPDYTAQAGVIITGIYTGDDSSIEKKLSKMSVQCEPLPANASIVLKYKSDAETTFTTICTIDADDTVSYEPINIEGTGVNFNTSKEVQFKFEELGGAKLTGFSCNYEELKTQI